MIKKWITILLSVVMLVSVLGCFTAFGADGEFVYFGSYPQEEVAETQELKLAGYDANGDATVDGHTYRRVKTDNGYKYFAYSPIKWQKFGNTLIACHVIDSKMYDEQEEKIKDFMGGVKYAEAVLWEDCSLRKWLNGTFSETAFTAEESAFLSEEIRLVTRAEAEAQTKEILSKTATGYAGSQGIEPRGNGVLGNADWLLKDISPVTKSAVCYVTDSGKIDTGIKVLVNEKGMGIVPCITISDMSHIPTHREPMPEKTAELYYPGGRTALFAESGVDAALANGWFSDKADAMYASGLFMKEQFQKSHLSDAYDWRLYQAKGRAPYISIEAGAMNMTPREAVDFVYPLLDAFYTGDIETYMEIHVSFPYGKETASSLSEFSDTVGKSIHDAVEACWSGWGDIVSCDGGAGRLNGTKGIGYHTTLRLKINGNGNYSINTTHYINTVHRLAYAASQYSDRPLGQIEFLRHYFGQNTIYDGRQFNNEPSSLVSNGVGICGSYANFMMDFCRLLGIPCLIYTNEQAMHAWNGVYVEGKWYEIDHTGSDDKEYMRKFYSDYSVDGYTYSFNPAGFPETHTAEHVSFMKDSYLPVDNLSTEDVAYAQSRYQKNEHIITANTPEPWEAPFVPFPYTDDTIDSPEMPVKPETPIRVLLYGEPLTFDVDPIIENGRTLVPMRKIFEALEATVYWNAESRTVTAVRGVDVITITIDETKMTKNGESIELDVPARLVDSRTLVPVRVIAESFGLSVSWNATTRTVEIS